MTKPWVTYLAAVFILLAGILHITIGNIRLGVFFVIVAVAGLVLKLYFQNKMKQGNDQTNK